MAEDNNFSVFNGNPQQWDLLQLFPEARAASGDPFALKRITDEFLLSREAQIEPLRSELQEAVNKRDGNALLKALEKRLTLQADIARVDGYMMLLQAEHSNQYAIQKMQGQDALASSLLKDNLESIDRPLRALSQADKNQLMQQTPALEQYAFFFSPLEKRLYEKRSFEEVDKIQEAESVRRQQYEDLYKTAQENGKSDPANPQHAALMDAALTGRMINQHQVASVRGYSSPLEMFADRNGVGASTVVNILNMVPAYYPATYQALQDMMDNQYALRWGTLNNMHKAQRNKRYTWEEAKQLVIEAFDDFHPGMAQIAAKAFEEGWIHAEPKTGKTPSQFTFMAVPQTQYAPARPYISINFDGSISDVVTLAHEMSHAVANYMAGEMQRDRFHASVAMHECFATLGEKLVIRKMLEKSPDPVQSFLISSYEVMKGVRKIANTTKRARFEYGVFEAVKDSDGGFRALPHEKINEIYERELRALEGPHFKDKPYSAAGWMNDSDHIVNNFPYYNITYALSEFAGSALMERWQAGDPQQKEAFAQTWVNLMRAGGNVQFSQAMLQLGLPVDDPEFIRTRLEKTAQSVFQLHTDIEQVPLAEALGKMKFRDKVHLALEVLDKKFFTPVEKKWNAWFSKKEDKEAQVQTSTAMPPQPAAENLVPPAKTEKPQTARFAERIEAQRSQPEISSGISV